MDIYIYVYIYRLVLCYCIFLVCSMTTRNRHTQLISVAKRLLCAAAAPGVCRINWLLFWVIAISCGGSRSYNWCPAGLIMCSFSPSGTMVGFRAAVDKSLNTVCGGQYITEWTLVFWWWVREGCNSNVQCADWGTWACVQVHGYLLFLFSSSPHGHSSKR